MGSKRIQLKGMNMYFQLLSSIFCFIFFSCSNRSIASNETKEIVQLKELDQSRKDLFIKARNSKPEEACKIYRELYKDRKFALRKLVAIRILKTCTLSRTQSIALVDALLDKGINEYLKEEFYLTGFEILDKFQEKTKASRFATEVASRQRTSAKKEEWFLKALTLAKESKDLDAIEYAKEKLHEKFPRFIKDPTEDQFYSVARDWEKKRKFTQARSFYRKAFNSSLLTATERINAHFRYAFTFRLDRDRKTYAAELTKMMKWMRSNFGSEVSRSTDKQLLHAYWDRFITEAKSYWNIGDFNSCYQKLTSLIERTPQGKYKAEVLWTLGKMHLERKQLSQALSFYQRALDVEADDQEINSKIVWSLAWNHYLSKNYAEAVTTLDRGLETIESTFVKAKLKFWKGRSLLKEDKNSSAKAVFQELASEDPYGFYGISAHHYLGQSMKAIDHQKPTTTLHYEALDWLNIVEERDLSRRFLEEISKKMTEPEEISNLLPLYTESKFYSGGLLKFFRIPAAKRAPYFEKHITSVFPTAYLELAKVEAEKRDVPLPLIMGLIRQESAFDTFARSWADAFGLMQLLPERAKELASAAGVEYRDFNDLYDPEKNIKLGTLLLSQYLTKWKHNFIGYISSYNAGSGAINRWLKSRYRKDPFEFIEMIPYEETQGYNKLIFRNYVTYLRLTGNDVEVNPEFLWNSKIEL